MITERATLLTAVAETIVGVGPSTGSENDATGSGHESTGSGTGGWDATGFLAEAGAELADLGPAVESLLDRVTAEAPDFAALDHDRRQAVLDRIELPPRLARLLNADYYATPRAWAEVRWSPAAADGWPDPLPAVSYGQQGWITPDQLLDRYDAIVVGAGAGGGAAAQVLAESGRRILIIEAGTAPTAAELSRDHLRNPRVNFGLDRLTDPRGGGWPRTIETPDGEEAVVGPGDPGWGGNAHTLGGGTRVFGAQAWRFAPDDFRMASRYGVPDGSALADWPIGYDDLEPFYDEAERRFGVSGAAGGDPWAGPRSRDYPMPPLAGNRPAERLAAGAARLGWSTVPVPLLINSEPYRGRLGCRRCSQCVGFACPVEAKSGTHNTAIPAAVATGNASVLLGSTVEKLITDASGRVIKVAIVGDHGGAVWRREVAATEFLLGAGTIETARLLLNSAHDREPDGLGNAHDQVGRHLQGHPYGGATGLFDDEVTDLVGPGPAIATCDFRHGNDGLVGGGMIAEEFVPTPASTYAYLTDAGIIPRHGRDAHEGMRHWLRRMLRVVGPYQEVSTADSRVRLDPKVIDRYGIRVARLSGTLHPEDVRGRDFLSQRAAEWLTAAGAARVVTPPAGGRPGGPNGGQHQAGSCRMGDDPARSVTDPVGRVWGHANVRIVDGSTHVTNGGVNPVLTILANSLRISGDLVR